MAFIQGLIAGYGIAIPVGAIAVLIIGISIQKGFRVGFWAGAGAATADIVFACLAALAGQILSAFLQPYAHTLQIASGMVLIGLGGYGLWRMQSANTTASAATPHKTRIFWQFLAITLLNPLTITYFGALIIGGAGGQLTTPANRLLFVLGAGVASLSWQTLLAALGALAGQQFSGRWQTATNLIGNLIIAGLGVSTLARFFLL